jgi:ribonucrease Y
MPDFPVSLAISYVPGIWSLLFASLFGAVLATLIFWYYTRHSRAQADLRARTLLELARKQAEVDTDRLRTEADLEIQRRKAEAGREIDRREMEIDVKLREIRSHEESLAALDHDLQAREDRIARENAAIKHGREAVRTMSRNLRRTMENLASMDSEEIKANLREQVKQECQDELRLLRKEIVDRSERDLEMEARRVLVTAMQRMTSRPNNDITATIVQLPNEEMKGRIIGREGRNIKCFEAATGTTLLIDESPQMVLISSFDPVRREIAKVSLENLIADGRIHPASIEDFVRKAQEEVDAIVRQSGEQAIDQLKLNGIGSDVASLLGRLKYRFSYTQNVLDHSIEVAYLCSLLASEIGLDPGLAKRAGLLHDIGKAIEGEYEGSHATIGAEFIRRRGEDPIVVNAVAAHHEEVAPESVYAGLVILADTISAIRPGARAESMTAYIDRLHRLEKLATEFEGVQSAYAIQAGREVRVVVHPTKVTDEQAHQLARQLRRRIEEELQYPSTIKVTVIREQRFVELAK